MNKPLWLADLVNTISTWRWRPEKPPGQFVVYVHKNMVGQTLVTLERGGDYFDRILPWRRRGRFERHSFLVGEEQARRTCSLFVIPPEGTPWQ